MRQSIDDLEKIRSMATMFRKAIERAKYERKLVGFMTRFPDQTCSYTSDLLQRYLLENGIFTLYVSGDYRIGGKVDSHAWLETKDEIIIDITGDQYNNRNDEFFNDCPVYVGGKTKLYSLFRLNGEKLPYILEKSPLGMTKHQLEKEENYSAIVSLIDE